MVCKVSKEDMPILAGRPAGPSDQGTLNGHFFVCRDFWRKKNYQEFAGFSYLRSECLCVPLGYMLSWELRASFVGASGVTLGRCTFLSGRRM